MSDPASDGERVTEIEARYDARYGQSPNPVPILLDDISALLADRAALEGRLAHALKAIELTEGQVAALAQQVEDIRGVVLRRHERLRAALGDDPGYSVDMTIDKAIERLAGLAAENERQRVALHDAQAIGDFLAARVVDLESELANRDARIGTLEAEYSDLYRQFIDHSRKSEAKAARIEALTREAARWLASLREIKTMVVGEARPRWSSDVLVAASRNQIADIVDAALSAPAEPTWACPTCKGTNDGFMSCCNIEYRHETPAEPPTYDAPAAEPGFQLSHEDAVRFGRQAAELVRAPAERQPEESKA